MLDNLFLLGLPTLFHREKKRKTKKTTTITHISKDTLVVVDDDDEAYRIFLYCKRKH
jgi:hypothetical protein